MISSEITLRLKRRSADSIDSFEFTEIKAILLSHLLSANNNALDESKQVLDKFDPTKSSANTVILTRAVSQSCGVSILVPEGDGCNGVGCNPTKEQPGGICP